MQLAERFCAQVERSGSNVGIVHVDAMGFVRSLND